MKCTFVILLLSVATICRSQNIDNALSADSGKNEFKQQYKTQEPNYSTAFRILTNQIARDPQNAELHYFLGCTIDKMNSFDAKQMLQLTPEMTSKASEPFEEVNRLSPVYKGEIFLLDPYSKISSIWGSLAMAYLNRELTDSAKWAFKQGKIKGGFLDPVLDFNRQLLNSCDRNAILVSSGDIVTIPLWYLQTVENFRNDVIVIDGNMINSAWYIKYLQNKRKVRLTIPDIEIDTLEYLPWSQREIILGNSKDPLNNFKWQLKPTYFENYILKGDTVLLDVLHQYYFKKPVYFLASSDSTYNLFLGNDLIDAGLVCGLWSKIFNHTGKLAGNLRSYNIEKMNPGEIKKSRDAINLVNGLRMAYYTNVYRLLTLGEYDSAKKLLAEAARKFPKNKLPFVQGEEEYSEQLYAEAHKNDQ